MLTTAGVGPDEKVQDLGNRMRCRECDEKGSETDLDPLGRYMMAATKGHCY